MADQNAGPGAADQGTPLDPDQEAQNQIDSFQTEAFEHGEVVVAKPPKVEASPAQKKEEVPAGAEASKSGEGDDAGEGDDPGEGDAPKPKKAATVQDRIDELTRKRREADRRAEAAEQRLAEIEARLRKEAPAEGATAAKESAKDEGPKEPDPAKYKFGELDSKYIRDLARYETDVRWAEHEAEMRQSQEKARTEERLTESQKAAVEKWNGLVKSGAEKYDDFSSVVVEGAEHEEWALSTEMGALLLESEVGADIAYHLASNPEESIRVARMAPLEQARYFGKLEVKFSAAQAAAKKDEEPAPPRTPKAPPPPERARGRGGQMQASANTEDFAAFERMAMQENN